MFADECVQSLCLREEWQEFIASGKKPEHMNSYILDSWERSKEYGINPFDVRGDLLLSKKELTCLLRKYEPLIKVVRKYTDKIYEIIQGQGYLIYLTDNIGTLLYIEGDVSEEFNEKACFKIGAFWGEKSVGTTAASMALNLKIPISFMSEEKFCLELKSRACSAVPIKDAGGNIMAILGIAANFPNADTEIFGMLLIAATAVENHMKMIHTMEEVRFFGSYYKTVLDSVSDGVLVIDKRGLLINANKNAEKILSVHGESLLGRPADEILKSGTKIADLLRTGLNTYKDEFTVRYSHNGDEIQLKNAAHVFHKNGEIGGVIDIINQIQDNRRPAKKDTEETSKITFEDIIGRSKELREAKRQACLAASHPVSVLITGETGTGKELFVRAMHNASDRSKGPFIAINCGALPRELIESELFGYEEGAFTGGRRGGHPGKFELASGGTIFLDEIAEIPPDMQVKLLRVLQQKEVVRIGGIKTIPIDVKVVSATNKDLIQEINEGRFRQDLYWRINVITIHIPSLAQRKDDIELLADYFLEKFNAKYQKNLILDNSTRQLLTGYTWPGNVRELENAMLRAVTFAQGNVVLPDNLPMSMTGKSAGLHPNQSDSLADNEKNIIEKHLRENAGNICRTAKTLGISRSTLYYKLKKYNIELLRR